MTRRFLKTTTAMAVALSLAAPHGIGTSLAQEARPETSDKAAPPASPSETPTATEDGEGAPPEDAAEAAAEAEPETDSSAEAGEGDAAPQEDAEAEAPAADAPQGTTAENVPAADVEPAVEDAASSEEAADAPAETGEAPAQAADEPPAEAAPAADRTEAKPVEETEDEAEAAEAPEEMQPADEEPAVAQPQDQPSATEDAPAAAEAEQDAPPAGEAPAPVAEDEAEEAPVTPDEDDEIASEDDGDAPAAEDDVPAAEDDAPAAEDDAPAAEDDAPAPKAEKAEDAPARQPDAARPEASAPASAEAESAEPVEVTTETVTEETSRSSDEDVAEAQAEARAASGDEDDDDSRINTLLGILGAAGAGLAVGSFLGGDDGGEVVENTGDRVVIERDGQYFVRSDENQLLRRPGTEVQTSTFTDGSTRSVATRENDVQVVTIRDPEGYVVRRSRVLPDGREIVMFDDIAERREQLREEELARLEAEARESVRAEEARRQVSASTSDRQALRQALEARPWARLDRGFSLRQVRENVRVRELMPSLDLDAITFESGSAAISPRQARSLDELGRAIEEILAENPAEVFLVEGHTDAVGGRAMNLALSDRRAESVALALTEFYDIPPENLIPQGYGEEHLKVQTQADERANRRATVRRITPLLSASR